MQSILSQFDQLWVCVSAQSVVFLTDALFRLNLKFYNVVVEYDQLGFYQLFMLIRMCNDGLF